MENAKRPLPRELLFLRDFARAKELPVDELLAWLPKQLEQIRLHAGQLRQHGFDPDYMVGLLQPVLARAQAAQAEPSGQRKSGFTPSPTKRRLRERLLMPSSRSLPSSKQPSPSTRTFRSWKTNSEQLRQQYPKLGDD